ncbi:MAG: HEPN domain-containing protein [Acidobacteria bacterium]|nr:HEPN domain-containing protein [Acidobacteriota bacterium]MDW7984014.1 HEPN domain-containing protein [Acidobacteriota bacterium]
MKPLTQEWVDKAKDDYKVTKILLDLGVDAYDIVCFHAQQCVEKYLKAWLTEQDVDFPRTHDLELLAKLAVPTLAELQRFLDELRLLTSFAIEVRYSGTSATRVDADAVSKRPTRCAAYSVEVGYERSGGTGLKPGLGPWGLTYPPFPQCEWLMRGAATP